MENSAGGLMTRISMPAIQMVLIRSWSLSKRRVSRKMLTMITARWVEGDIPARKPYASTGIKVRMAAVLLVQPAHKTGESHATIQRKIANVTVATIPM